MVLNILLGEDDIKGLIILYLANNSHVNIIVSSNSILNVFINSFFVLFFLMYFYVLLFVFIWICSIATLMRRKRTDLDALGIVDHGLGDHVTG